jgi:hypothetical protein
MKIKNKTFTDLEDSIYNRELIIEIEKPEDLDRLKNHYNIEDDGFYLKVKDDGSGLEISKKGYFFAESRMASSIYLSYLDLEELC